MRIGCIGLGLMGIPMAKNILAKGGDLSIWNRTREKTRELESLGAKVCDTKVDLAKEVDILITMVTAGEDVYDILFGAGGVAMGLRKGAIVIDMSTIGVEWALRISEDLSKMGIHFLDAPVTGSTPKAITGELTIFIGGETVVYETARSILSMMGTNLQYMGSTGSGQAMKLINNSLVAFSMIGLSEVMKLAASLGLSLERTAEVMKTLPVSSPYIAMKVENFVRDEYPVMFSLANMTKDMGLASEAMRKHGLDLPLLDLAHLSYLKALGSGYGDLDVSAIGKV